MPSGEIAILDFGSQYTHLIARRARELGVVSRVYPNDAKADELSNAVGIILSGGPKSTLGEDALAYDPALFKLGVPILGLCYGHQLMAKHFGGKVNKGIAREYGLTVLTIEQYNNITINPRIREIGVGNIVSSIFTGVASDTTVWMSHGDHVEKLPDGFVQIATTGNDSVAAMANEEKRLYGFQFHPEVHHTKDGKKILENFLFGICHAEKNWTTGAMLAQIETEIRRQAGTKKVFLLLSGGVDSTVCFALLEKVLGKERVYGFHVDHGFMRHNESKQVQDALAVIGITDLHVYHAEAEFLKALEGVTEPEQKRKIIGNLFLDITDRVMKKLPGDANDWLLGQGTIYPDTIESGGTKNADKIKTHHNRVDRIHEIIAAGRIIEPIKELYKDEVREIGAELGLPKELLNRHPFPGPGLAIRCLCWDNSNTLPPHRGDVRGVVVRSENATFNDNPSSASPTRGGNVFVLPIKSVGVQGDERSYAHPAILSGYGGIPTRPLPHPPLVGGGQTMNSSPQQAAGYQAKIQVKFAEAYPPSLKLRRVRPRPSSREASLAVFGRRRKKEVLPLVGLPTPHVLPLVGGGEEGVKIPWNELHKISPEITNSHKDINRVLIRIAGDEKKLMQSTVRPATLTKERLDKLRAIDVMINNIIMNHPCCQHIWQMPVVLVPFGYHHGESVIIRPVESEEAMTVKFAELPESVLKEIKSAFFALNLADFLLYDITNKPPGTIEWE